MLNDSNERIIQVLYFRGKLKLVKSDSPWWLPSTEEFEKFLEFVSKLKQVEKVEMSSQVMEGERIRPILTALLTQAKTLKELKF